MTPGDEGCGPWIRKCRGHRRPSASEPVSSGGIRRNGGITIKWYRYPFRPFIHANDTVVRGYEGGENAATGAIELECDVCARATANQINSQNADRIRCKVLAKGQMGLQRRRGRGFCTKRRLVIPDIWRMPERYGVILEWSRTDGVLLAGRGRQSANRRYYGGAVNDLCRYAEPFRDTRTRVHARYRRGAWIPHAWIYA